MEVGTTSAGHPDVGSSPMCEARFFSDTSSPPRISTLSHPESRRCVDEARHTLYGTNHLLSPAGEYMRGANVAADSHRWRLLLSRVGCCRLKKACVTAPWDAADY